MNSLRSGSYHEPDYSMALARIQHMNKDELNELLNNEAKMDDYIKSLDQVKNSSNWSVDWNVNKLWREFQFFIDQEFV